MSRFPIHKWWKTLCYSNISGKSNPGKLKIQLSRNAAVAHWIYLFMGWISAHEKSPAGFKIRYSFYVLKPAESQSVGSKIDKYNVLEQHSWDVESGGARPG